ncbi:MULTISPECIES: D-amino acid dehydrogenase [unclassified Caballeronia]|uniref:D-amino acid dehydrogenase n=1 Tax=unclassified Caballeronia TaxID=2646786 RepID=UPI0028625800|nr:MULTISPECIES: D-amino acid dehydrogenase [unclassified Caballeronia]MDR5774045.1 D-amino acid dehydrogenase [Caballeronia sp. LZ002]MDR5849480.1 D-amino acid dehydrogenase [Caballeronia sp. LZ003]
MNILVIGAGVIGLTTAYRLREDGHEVSVIDRRTEVAAEASRANGAQLSYSYVAPLAGPGVLAKLPGWLMRRDAPVRVSPAIDMNQWRWCWQFARACTQAMSESTTAQLLALSFLSRSLMHEFTAAHPMLAFDYVRAGKLVMHRSAMAMSRAASLLSYQRTLGSEQQALGVSDCVALEPALAQVADRFVGGIYTPGEEAGDCHRFCVGLESLLRERGVAFELGTAVSSLSVSNKGEVRAIAGSRRLDAEHVVVASGCDSAALLRTIGVRVPVYPLKGYSLTLDAVAGKAAPATSVTDFDRKVVYARLGDRLRVAGMADIVGHSSAIDATRLATLRREAQAVFPQAGDYDAAAAWAGLRPATPRGTPIIGGSKYRNLWLNVGHGALGFTLAMGSAHVLAQRMAGRQPSLDDTPFSPRAAS